MRSTRNEETMPESVDQRAFKRYQVNMTVHVHLISEEEKSVAARQNSHRCPSSSVIVTDLSLSGLVFISAKPYHAGALVEIQFSFGAHVHSVRALIRRCQPMALPGRHAFHCAAQLVRSEGVSRFIPAVAKYLHHRYGANASFR